ncbi:hypothetical protein HDV05_003792, partial [Chytridiales sp. JEL 0842]
MLSTGHPPTPTPTNNRLKRPSRADDFDELDGEAGECIEESVKRLRVGADSTQRSYLKPTISMMSSSTIDSLFEPNDDLGLDDDDLLGVGGSGLPPANEDPDEISDYYPSDLEESTDPSSEPSSDRRKERAARTVERMQMHFGTHFPQCTSTLFSYQQQQEVEVPRFLCRMRKYGSEEGRRWVEKGPVVLMVLPNGRVGEEEGFKGYTGRGGGRLILSTPLPFNKPAQPSTASALEKKQQEESYKSRLRSSTSKFRTSHTHSPSQESDSDSESETASKPTPVKHPEGELVSLCTPHLLSVTESKSTLFLFLFDTEPQALQFESTLHLFSRRFTHLLTLDRLSTFTHPQKIGRLLISGSVIHPNPFPTPLLHPPQPQTPSTLLLSPLAPSPVVAEIFAKTGLVYTPVQQTSGDVQHRL